MRTYHDTHEYDRFHVSIAEVPFDSVGILRTTLLLRTTCMRSCCTTVIWGLAVWRHSKPTRIDSHAEATDIVSHTIAVDSLLHVITQ